MTDKNLTIRIEKKFRDTVQKIAKRHYISLSAATKQALEMWLKSHGVEDWRKEEE